MCLGLCFLGSNFLVTPWASWTFLKVYFLCQAGKFSFIMFSDKFSISCSSSFPSCTPMIWMLEHLKLSWKILFFVENFIFLSFFIAETLTNSTIVEIQRFSFFLEWLFLKENESSKSKAIKMVKSRPKKSSEKLIETPQKDQRVTCWSGYSNVFIMSSTSDPTVLLHQRCSSFYCINFKFICA